MFKDFARFIRLFEFDSSTILEKILSILYSSIRGDAVFLSLVGYRWTIVSSLSALSTSLRTLKFSSTLQIFLFTIGVPILPWYILLFPISIDVRTILLLLRVDSSCNAITSVWDLYGLRGNVLVLKIILLESVKTSVMTFLTMLVPPVITPRVMPRPMIPTPTAAGLTPTILTDVLRTWVSVIGSLLASTCLLESLIST